MSPAEFAIYYQRVNGTPPPSPHVKPHKFNAKRVVVDGQSFPSLLEARWYATLCLWAKAGAITEPLRQVPFSLGVHYGRERVYISDFCYVDLSTHELVVADAKGFQTRVYQQKKSVFESLYHLPITELHDTREPHEGKTWHKPKRIHKAK